MPVENLPFALVDEPHCAWAPDLRKQSLGYVEKLDPEHFNYVAAVHGYVLLGTGPDDPSNGIADLDFLEETDGQRAALALRLNYHHCLEAFFALLFAAVQAPAAIHAWLSLYRGWHLRPLVERAEAGEPIPSSWLLDTAGWTGLARSLVHYNDEDDPDKTERTRKQFGRLWERFASDFLDEGRRDEYNSIKHGHRAHSGGFHIRMGGKSVPGVPPDDDEMRDIGGSDYGASYFKTVGLGGPHHGFSHRHLNWSPKATIKKTQLLVVSMNNIISTVRRAHGLAPDDVQYVRPEDDEAFDEPWRLEAQEANVGSMKIEPDLPVDEITKHPEEVVRGILRDWPVPPVE